MKQILAHLDIEFTERCNNNCLHCYINLPQDDAQAQKKELSTQKLKDILQEAVDLGCLDVRFTGGEPLLREDFEELYVFSRKLGLRVVIFTNATLITPRLAEVFSRIRPLHKIEISVYGMRQQSYEAVTRKSGSHAACFQGINLLLEKKIPFVVKGALLPQNRDEIDEFNAWAKNIPWMSEPPRYSMFYHPGCRKDAEKNRQIQSLRPSPQQALAVLARDKAGYFKTWEEFCRKFLHPQGERLFSCGSGVGIGSVDAYGSFFPCLLLKSPQAAYDLKQGSLRDALENFFPRVREARATDVAYLARCAKCFLKGLCEQCPAKSWLEHGVLDKPVDYLCAVAHAQARFLGLLKNEEAAWEVKDYQARISGINSADKKECVCQSL